MLRWAATQAGIAAICRDEDSAVAFGAVSLRLTLVVTDKYCSGDWLDFRFPVGNGFSLGFERLETLTPIFMPCCYPASVDVFADTRDS